MTYTALSNMPANVAGSPESGLAARSGPPPAAGPPPWLLGRVASPGPLHAPFCSTRDDYMPPPQELDSAQWRQVLSQARALGPAQLGLSGGEPLLRDDLEDLVGHARQLGFYTNL